MTATPGTRPPAWERLRQPAGTRLRVAPPEPRELDVLELDDGDAPQLGGATVFLVERAAGGFEAWAARIERDGFCQPYRVTASRLRVRARDDALARHLGFDAQAPPRDVEWTWIAPPAAPAQAAASAASAAASADPSEIVCECRGITRAEIQAAVGAGWRSVDAVKRATKATFGECQSRRCGPEIARMIGLAPEDPRAAISPRPPLVPVPASILAAFGS